MVVLNAEFALRLERVGCPVVYIDTNPFMWTEHELIPQTVTHYCARLCPALPQLCWPVLRGITSLRRVRLSDACSSCLTYLANNGVPDHILARWAGHTNVKTTKKWYVKPDVEDLREAATTWDGLHGAATEG